MLEGGAIADAEAQGSLAHTGTAGKNYEIAGLQPGAEPVQVAERSGNAQGLSLIAVKELQVGKGVQQDILERIKRCGGPSAAQLVYHPLRLCDKFFRFFPFIVTHAGYPGRQLDQSAEQGFFLDNTGVVIYVGGSRHYFCQCGNVNAAGLFQVPIKP